MRVSEKGARTNEARALDFQDFGGVFSIGYYHDDGWGRRASGSGQYAGHPGFRTRGQDEVRLVPLDERGAPEPRLAVLPTEARGQELHCQPGLAWARGRSGRGALKSSAPGWGAGCCKVLEAVNFQTTFIESGFEPTPPQSMSIHSPLNQRPNQL